MYACALYVFVYCLFFKCALILKILLPDKTANILSGNCFVCFSASFASCFPYVCFFFFALFFFCSFYYYFYFFSLFVCVLKIILRKYQ